MTYEQPDRTIVKARCSACYRAAYLLMRDSGLVPRGNHRRCGEFDPEAAKEKIDRAYQEWQERGSPPQYPTVMITPEPPHNDRVT
jgi:hypothetical protein